ncbi:MAG: type VI secretion system contractile sheath large subunit [Thiohalomonas sp.]|nr:type VI secretion system contractile sheath large subunit [Thiohalomonas sp.]
MHTDAQEDDAATLERLLGKGSTQNRQAEEIGQSMPSRYIGEVIAEYIVPQTSPYRDIYIQAVDEAVSVQMRELLHHPDFKALEAVWRCLLSAGKRA